jgi:hypothetical protein
MVSDDVPDTTGKTVRFETRSKHAGDANLVEMSMTSCALQQDLHERLKILAITTNVVMRIMTVLKVALDYATRDGLSYTSGQVITMLFTSERRQKRGNQDHHRANIIMFNGTRKD